MTIKPPPIMKYIRHFYYKALFSNVTPKYKNQNLIPQSVVIQNSTPATKFQFIKRGEEKTIAVFTTDLIYDVGTKVQIIFTKDYSKITKNSTYTKEYEGVVQKIQMVKRGEKYLIEVHINGEIE